MTLRKTINYKGKLEAEDDEGAGRGVKWVSLYVITSIFLKTLTLTTPPPTPPPPFKRTRKVIFPTVSIINTNFYWFNAICCCRFIFLQIIQPLFPVFGVFSSFLPFALIHLVIWCVAAQILWSYQALPLYIKNRNERASKHEWRSGCECVVFCQWTDEFVSPGFINWITVTRSLFLQHTHTLRATF